MKKRIAMMLGIMSCSMLLFACSSKQDKLAETSAAQTEAAAEAATTAAEVQKPEAQKSEAQKSEAQDAAKPQGAEATVEFVTEDADLGDEFNGEPAEDDMYSYPSEDAESVFHDSRLGYTCMYNPAVFTLDDTAEDDRFVYNTAEQLKAPVYMTVQLFEDMNADELAGGLALQSGLEADQIQLTYFGADGIETKSIYVEQDISGVKQVITYYVIPTAKGALLVELGGYVGMPEGAEYNIQEIAATFALK